MVKLVKENGPAEEKAPQEGNNAGQENVARERETRRLLACTSTVPEHLTNRWPVMDNVTIFHTITKDSTLPFFQARLHSGTYENKILN